LDNKAFNLLLSRLFCHNCLYAITNIY